MRTVATVTYGMLESKRCVAKHGLLRLEALGQS